MLLYIPTKLVKQCQGPKWFDSDIRHHLKCLRTLRHSGIFPLVPSGVPSPLEVVVDWAITATGILEGRLAKLKGNWVPWANKAGMMSGTVPPLWCGQ